MSETGLKTHHFLVYGKVQRVGFRRWAQDRADEIGVRGWVRNRPDGRVELAASGAPEGLAAYRDALLKGPTHARVVRVEMREIRPRDFPEFDRKPTGPKTAEPIVDIVEALDPAYLAACQNAYEALPIEARRMNRFERKQGNWRFGQIDAAALKCGIGMAHLGPNAPPSLLCQTGGLRFGLDVSRPSWVGPLTEELSNNKFLTKILLEELGIPVPVGEICRTADEARAAFEKIGGAAVVKPVFGTEAKGITLNVTSAEACERAFAYAQAHGRKGLVLVEDYVRGVDLRLLLLGDRIIAAYLRLPANVVGDGQQTIAELVTEKNLARFSLPSTQEAHLLTLGLKQRRLLTQQGYAPEHVLEKGKIALLGVTPNYIDGAELLSIADQLHPEIAEIASRTARVIDATAFWGIDILTENFAAPLAAAKSVVCEVNSRPVGGVFRYATHGAHVHFFDEVFKAVTEAPSLFTPRETFPPAQIAPPPSPDPNAPFGRQVADILKFNLPDAVQLTPDLFALGDGSTTKFYLANPNPSFVRGALAPWRWMDLRSELEKAGIPVTAVFDLAPDDPGGGDATPLGRAFVFKPRAKMTTLWLDSTDTLDRVRQENMDGHIALERFEAPVRIEVAVIAGRPRATAKIVDGPLLVAEDRAQLDSFGRSAALSRNVHVQTDIDESISAICDDLINLLPGFTLGTVVFRLRADGVWAVSDIRSGLEPTPFLDPDSGQPVDLAALQAAHALDNPRHLNARLPKELMALAAR